MKRVLVLFLCLVLAFSSLVACSGDDSGSGTNDSSANSGENSGSSSTQDSDDGAGTVSSGDTDNSSTVNSGNTDNSSTVNSGNTDNSSTVNSDNTDSSSTVNSGNTDSSNTTGSTGTENDSTDEKEQITIKFTCFSGNHVSGEKEVKIDKGSVILPEQMPVITRESYVLFWAYDKFGEILWQEGDTFEKDMELFGVWKSVEDLEAIALKQKIDALVNYSNGFNNYQMEETTTGIIDGNSMTQALSLKVDGDNQSQVISGYDMVSRIWYVDGVFYINYESGEKYKCELTRERFLELTTAGVPKESSFFGIPASAVKSIDVRDVDGGTCYEVAVDGEKMSNIRFTYSNMSYAIYFDGEGTVSHITASYNCIIAGSEQLGEIEYTLRSDYSNVGSTVVDAPENADEFEYNPNLNG